MSFIIKILGTIFLAAICIKLLFIMGSGFWYLCINVGDYLNDKRKEKYRSKKNKNIQCMGKCKNCKYWTKDNGEYKYNDNFGYCTCIKMVYKEDLYDELGYDLDKNQYDNYHVIYSDSEGLVAELKVHKEFGCIDFEEFNRRKQQD